METSLKVPTQINTISQRCSKFLRNTSFCPFLSLFGSTKYSCVMIIECIIAILRKTVHWSSCLATGDQIFSGYFSSGNVLIRAYPPERRYDVSRKIRYDTIRYDVSRFSGDFASRSTRILKPAASRVFQSLKFTIPLSWAIIKLLSLYATFNFVLLSIH